MVPDHSGDDLAKSPEEVEGELADLLEVVRGLAAATGVSWADVETRANVKRQRRGGFDSGIVLLETAWPKDADIDREQSKTVSLSSLAIKSEGPVTGLNYASLLANGADRVLQLADGSRIQISLSGSGVSVRVVEGRKSKPEQIGLPGLEKKDEQQN